jgi:hypothetical protein
MAKELYQEFFCPYKKTTYPVIGKNYYTNLETGANIQSFNSYRNSMKIKYTVTRQEGGDKYGKIIHIRISN